MKQFRLAPCLALAAALLAAPAAAQTPAPAPAKKPNILIIWGDDIGYWNVSAYNQGMMGYKTPNIDRIAKEGALFTDWYGQQSCTAGRAAFITGQVGFRTGLLKVGLPGAKEGLQARDVTIAQLLKAQGYMTAQFGKNHLGDRDEHLPTAHGFDEFFGSLYHLNAEEEPENPDYFKDPAMTQEVRHARRDPHLGEPGRHAEDREHRPADHEAHGDDRRGGHQGLARLPASARRRRTSRSSSGGTPPACTSGRTSRRRARARPASASIPTAWSSTTAMVGQLLDKLKELGLDDNTIVMYSTDNGAEKFSWPDGGTTPFRGEKNTNWEGGYRVPCAIRWPGVIKPGTVINDIFRPRRHAADAPGRRRRARRQGAAAQGHEGRRQDLQGPPRRLQHHRRAGRQGARARATSSSTSTTTARSSALRYDQWKIVFAEQRAHGFDVWQEPFVPLRLPKLFNLRSDPFEKADHDGMDYEPLADRPRLPARAGAGVRREVPGHVQGVPAEPEGRQLQPRQGHGGVVGRRGRTLTPP